MHRARGLKLYSFGQARSRAPLSQQRCHRCTQPHQATLRKPEELACYTRHWSMMPPVSPIWSWHETSRARSDATRGFLTWSSLPEEHSMLREMCRNFADNELAPNAGEWDKNHTFPKDQVRIRDTTLAVMDLEYSFRCWTLCSTPNPTTRLKPLRQYCHIACPHSSRHIQHAS